MISEFQRKGEKAKKWKNKNVSSAKSDHGIVGFESYYGAIDRKQWWLREHVAAAKRSACE